MTEPDARWICGHAELCELLGVGKGEVSRLRGEGVVIALGRDRYDAFQTVRNYLQRQRAHVGRTAPVLSAQRARVARAQAETLELKLKEARGELVRAVEVERTWAEILRGVRSRVLAVPSRLRAEVSLGGATAEALDRELRAALAELGEGGVSLECAPAGAVRADG